MWSLFARDPAKDFAYIIGEKVTGLEEKSVWSLHQGKKKGSGESVSVLVFDVKASSESQTALARAAFKRIKTLRHPNILTFLDGIETDKVIYIATEPVTPLETYLQNNDAAEKKNQLAISWGLHKVTKGLSFLVNDCGLIHNNVCMSSIFVDQAGEWKLGGVDYMYPISGPDSQPPVKILPYLERYDPPEKMDLKKGDKGEKWSSDMWGLGCLIWEVFNGPLPKTSALKAFGKIPKNLVPNYCELVSANPSSRPNPAKFISDCCQKGGFMNNPFVKTMLFLEEIQIKEQSEKASFFNKLTDAIDAFPKQLSRHKVLPQLLQAYEFGNCGSMVLAPLFKVGGLLDPEEYQTKIVPCVVKLFSSPDRNTRVKLLQQIHMFVEHLHAPVVNEKIFPNIISGFMDTNPVVRECTIKAMLPLAPKLNYKNMNEELMKHFARLQAKDDQGGIRTNTTVCLAKIASYLNPQMRQRILCSAFLRALKDPFPPVRQAGIIGMGTTQNLFNIVDIAQKLMPPLCAMTVDPDKNVRDQAFKTLKGFMERLEKVSENPDLQQEMEKDVLSGGIPDNSAAGWAGWAIGGVSTLTSKVYNKATTKNKNQDGVSLKSTSDTTLSSSAVVASTEAKNPSSLAKSADEDEPSEETGADGDWDDQNWGDIDAPAPVTDKHKSPERDQTTAKKDDKDVELSDNWDNDDDDDWGEIEVSPAHQPTHGSRLQHPVDTHKPPAKESGDNSMNVKQSNSGDWGWEDDQTETFTGASESVHKQAKGALKLGRQKDRPANDSSWIDEEFTPVQDASLKPTSSYNWGNVDKTDVKDFFSTIEPRQNKTKQNNPQDASSITTKTNVSSQGLASASRQSSKSQNVQHTVASEKQEVVAKTSLSNVYKDDGLGSAAASKQSETNHRKTEREEKHLQEITAPYKQTSKLHATKTTAVEKQDVDNKLGSLDTDAWNDGDWDSFPASKQTEADRKQLREERNLHRKQETTQKREAKKGGAMKLGAKKLNLD